MKILPAIDVIDGKCVRLFQGDFKNKNIYDTDISQTITRFKQWGASFLHIVDLSAAENPACSQKNLICQKMNEAGMPFQLGGGIRTQTQLDDLFQKGVSRIIIGSLCVQQPDLVRQWIQQYGVERFVLALDYRAQDNDYLLATHGWQQKSDVSLFDTIRFFATENVRILATNIAKDGSLTAPDFPLYAQIKQQFPQIILQASGGVSCEDDIRQLERMGVDEVIIGKAIYENKINLERILNHD